MLYFENSFSKSFSILEDLPEVKNEYILKIKFKMCIVSQEIRYIKNINLKERACRTAEMRNDRLNFQ